MTALSSSTPALGLRADRAGGVAPRRVRAATTEAPWVRRLVVGLGLGFMTLFLFVPERTGTAS